MKEAAQFKLHKTVVLVGMMGAGKTAVGRTLATKLDVPFLDSDAEIVEAAKMTIAEIFERDGEAFFRDREAEVINRLLESQPGILSTGGGAFLSERNRQNVSQKGVSIWLNADLNLLWGRVKNKNNRPLLRTSNPYQTLKELYRERVPSYEAATLTVKAQSRYSLEQMADRVIEVLLSRPDVLEAC
ncbi:MAG: shikimate kinase [Pseudomonadota bacterium]